MSYSGSTAAPEAPPGKQPRSLLTAAEGQAARDSDGLVQQRQRPLKINLDLALVGGGPWAWCCSRANFRASWQLCMLRTGRCCTCLNGRPGASP